MATPKAVAMAEQAARDKAQATLDEILERVKALEGTPVKGELLEAEESPAFKSIQDSIKAMQEEIRNLSELVSQLQKPESKLSEASRNVARQVTRK